MVAIKRQRDLTFIKTTENKSLVIACDSCGGIGNKEMDLLKVSPQLVGYYTTRVPLMEILSVGATPVAVINTLSVEMNPTGEEIIKGIEELLKEGEIPLESINGSTEENFQTVQTGIGVTIVGEVEVEKCKVGKSQVGDAIYLLGIPKVGGEIQLPHDQEICSLQSLKELVTFNCVNEIIPVGSKGIVYEVETLASLNDCKFQLLEGVMVDLTKSAGPATVVIFSMDKEKEKELSKKIKQPLTEIGKLI